MGTCSYVLTGTEQGMQQTFGSTCHGAVSYCKSRASTKILLNDEYFLGKNCIAGAYCVLFISGTCLIQS